MEKWDCVSLTVSEVRQQIKEMGNRGWSDEILSVLASDQRSGVQHIYQQMLNKKQQDEKEIARLESMLRFERMAHERGSRLIAGLDEAGRGPLAGPVAAAAVILPAECRIRQLNDSKILSSAVREKLFIIIREQALAYGIGFASPEEIDSINILQATMLAMKRALQQMEEKFDLRPDCLLLDAVQLHYDPQITEVPIIGGDGCSLSIAAASVLAKVSRDHLMLRYHEQYPQYGFAAHKGYGTAEHMQAIAEYGLCPIHRRSFAHEIRGKNSDR